MCMGRGEERAWSGRVEMCACVRVGDVKGEEGWREGQA